GRPSVVFVDEPTTGLDPGKREEVWRMIRRMTAGGGAVLLTTQYLEEADALADEISVIDHGRVIAHGTPAELKRLAGGQTIAVRPVAQDRLGEVAAIIGEVAGRRPDTAGGGVLTVPVEGDTAFIEAVRRLAAAEVELAELSLRLPSLDEVFVTLTGRRAGAYQADAGDASGRKTSGRTTDRGK